MRNLEAQFQMKLEDNEIIHKALTPIVILCFIAGIIWFGGPHLKWGNHVPLISAEKRFYIIVCVFLMWLLKFLMIDLDAPNPLQFKNEKVRKKLLELQNRFRGAIHFLNTATATKQGKAINLNKLPWYLLIGPTHSGKTTLLANSDVHFILQRQFQHHDVHTINSSENCDWWVTRDASIIDVPGKYLSNHKIMNQLNQNANIYPIIWQFFLRLLKSKRGKNGINGIIIALPAAEILKQNDNKHYHAILKNLFQRIHDIQKMFSQPLHCQIILTKCDLLPGFAEFFAESSPDEIAQAWGVALPQPKKDEKTVDIFSAHFNALIKKLNQQLLWRLHQERNPMARPYIKDFPLQIERIKEFTLDFINKCSSVSLNLHLQGVHLTSALQLNKESEGAILEQTINSNARELQLFREPIKSSRAYFIKQFITHKLNPTPVKHGPILHPNHWARRTAYAASFGIIAISTVLLGKDFQQGIKQTYAVQTHLYAYQSRIANIHDLNDHLYETINLLDALELAIKNNSSTLDFALPVSFYSKMSHQKTKLAYHQALQTVLIPEVKTYFEDYLLNPINKDADNIYGVLKAYLMLGDATYFDAKYICAMMSKIIPGSMQTTQVENLNAHLTAALTSAWNPVALSTKKIEDSRRFLSSLPRVKLSYIILKNIDVNNATSEINIGTNANHVPVFTTKKMQNPIPTMFTVKSFNAIIAQESLSAAQEALSGNWVLGYDANSNRNLPLASLAEQLRTAYINKYIDTWEKVLTNIHLSNSSDLTQLDTLLINLVSDDSPLLSLLRTLHDNTYFEPILSSSPKLQFLGLLVDKSSESQNLLYEIFSSLQSLHMYLQPVLGSENQRQAAFDLVSSRMLSRGKPDAITQLRIIAEKSPKPIKNWLEKIADDSWNLLMQEAGRFLDTSWQTKVIRYYQTEIANRYPFAKSLDSEVDIQKFVRFFGNPGVVLTFYNKYLQNFVDTSTQDWHWKKIEGQGLPFSEMTLRQIQQAMRIHHAFFPNNDNKLLVHFALQPYKFGNLIQKVKLNFNNMQFVDDRSTFNNTHAITWPTNNNYRMTSIQLTMTGQQTVRSNYPGNWGWFKLLNQSFESILTKNEVLINLSMNEHPVKYILSTDTQNNTFMSLNLLHFRLPQQLTEENMNSASV